MNALRKILSLVLITTTLGAVNLFGTPEDTLFGEITTTITKSKTARNAVHAIDYRNGSGAANQTYDKIVEGANYIEEMVEAVKKVNGLLKIYLGLKDVNSVHQITVTAAVTTFYTAVQNAITTECKSVGHTNAIGAAIAATGKNAEKEEIRRIEVRLKLYDAAFSIAHRAPGDLNEVIDVITNVFKKIEEKEKIEHVALYKRVAGSRAVKYVAATAAVAAVAALAVYHPDIVLDGAQAVTSKVSELYGMIPALPASATSWIPEIPAAATSWIPEVPASVTSWIPSMPSWMSLEGARESAYVVAQSAQHCAPHVSAALGDPTIVADTCTASAAAGGEWLTSSCSGLVSAAAQQGAASVTTCASYATEICQPLVDAAAANATAIAEQAAATAQQIAVEAATTAATTAAQRIAANAATAAAATAAAAQQAAVAAATAACPKTTVEVVREVVPAACEQATAALSTACATVVGGWRNSASINVETCTAAVKEVARACVNAAS